MPRPPAPCGTYPAYRRHLRKNEPVDAACKRAQREHDSKRRSKADDHPVVSMQPRPRSLEDLAQDARAAVHSKVHAVLDAVERDHVYEVIDREHELDALMEAWCEALDSVEAAKGWPGLPDELRASLMAAEDVR